jgi:hypothetical protein
VIKRGVTALAVLLIACGGRTGPVAPIPEAETGLRNFMQATADSNFVQMSQNWGTSRGSAGETGSPSDYQQRMVIIQAYMRGIQYRVLSNDPVANAANLRTLTVELTRGTCVTTLPFTMARTGSGRWVVYQFDLEKIGPPTRGCEPAAPAPGS